jgi:anti-anti-sigma regulatory factor
MSSVWFVPQEVKLVDLGAVYKQGLVYLDKHSETDVVFNFNKLSLYDSSIVSLLLAWIKYAKNKDCTLTFKDLQARIKHIAELSDTAYLIADHEI